MPRSRSLRLWSAAVALSVAALVLAGCSGGDSTFTGRVAAVEARSVTEIASLTVVDDGGAALTFTSEGFTGFTPSHLREHQATGEPVRVTYRKQAGGVLLIVRIEDG